MSSTFGIFESAKSGLSVSMQQLNVTEQNISNVNTAGYTRQRILTSAKEPATSVYLVAQLSKTLVGQGVEATGIQQIRSSYLDQQFRTLNTGYNYSASRSDSLSYLTGLYNELQDDSSLTSAVGKFFSALNTFSSDTSSKEFRTNVQQQALSMTQSFNNVYEEMQSLWHEQNESINTVTQKVNSIATKIAQLNDSIASAVQTGGTANDLNDERNLLLDELSGYVNITYSLNTTNDSMVDVKIGGLTLVDGKSTNDIEVDSLNKHQADIDQILNDIATANSDPTANAAALDAAEAALVELGDFSVTTNVITGTREVALGGTALVTGTTATPIQDAADSSLTTWIAYNRNNLTVRDHATLDGYELSIDSGTVKGGQLYSNMEMITSQSALSPGIPYYMDQINAFVRGIAENLNTISESGWTYPDGLTPSQTGISFFKVPADGAGAPDYARITAGNFTLSDEVIQSVYNIAGSSQEIILNSDSTNSGNNLIALEMFRNLANSSYYDKLNSIIGNLAIAADTSGSIMSTKQSLLRSVDTQRQSTSAVSLDEETTNLIIFQQSYNACARIITTIDEMLNTMINNMGIVGR